MKTKQSLLATALICIALSLSLAAHAAELKIAITQAEAGEARKFQPLLEYFGKKGISARFITAPDYQAAADMFSNGQVDAMFSGSGVAGTMIIKELAEPVARPVGVDGSSTYAADVIAPKGSPAFTGSADYFAGKRVIFSPLASAGEFFFHSLGASKAKVLMKAASHSAALDALGRGQADVAIVKNHVWTKEKDKYPQLEKVGGDNARNPDGTLIVSKKLDHATVRKLRLILLGLKDDNSPEASAAKRSLKIREFIKTSRKDFKGTIAMLKKAGVNKSFAFRF